MPHGILNLEKPTGLTSRDAVNRVQRLVRPLKAGHAGTLDPLASGVLVVCVGAATRLIEYVQRMPKQYVGTFLLGRTSPTEDVEGEVAELPDPPVPARDEIAEAARALTGTIMQRPPAFSALKVQGQRAYELARRGRKVELEPRPVTIHELTVESYQYPTLVLRITCSSGTYVRSLGRDLAEAAGTGAVMSALVRTAVGGFRLEGAIAPDALTSENWAAHLAPPAAAVEGLARLVLDAEEVRRVRQGQSIRRKSPDGNAAEIAATDAFGHLVALLVPRGPGQLGPSRTMPQ